MLCNIKARLKEDKKALKQPILVESFIWISFEKFNLGAQKESLGLMQLACTRQMISLKKLNLLFSSSSPIQHAEDLNFFCSILIFLYGR